MRGDSQAAALWRIRSHLLLRQTQLANLLDKSACVPTGGRFFGNVMAEILQTGYKSRDSALADSSLLRMVKGATNSERFMVASAGHRRRAFSLVELLVAIAILGTLLALLVPAIQGIRASVHRASCANNFRQIGIALNDFTTAQRCLPSNGGWDGKQTIKDLDGSEITVWTQVYAMSRTFTWGVGEPSRATSDQTGPWLYTILPYLDQQAVYQNRSWDTPIPVYICPSRRPNVPLKTQNDKYGASFGGDWNWAHCDYAGNRFLFPNRPVCVTPIQITDGISNTIMVGEKVMDPATYLSGSWYWDEPYFVGGSDNSARRGLKLLQDAVGVDVVQNWGSAHASSANFLFADGSVRELTYGLAPNVMLALLTHNESDFVPDY
jgi:prepilin-type N-terminal cleavage/methylation domain-containing protein/prepilin-type processing-associated H-X9-DG protein